MRVNHKNAWIVGASSLALALAMFGCDREISSTQKKTVESDGTVKTEEKTVKQSNDGTVTEETHEKTTEPGPADRP